MKWLNTWFRREPTSQRKSSERTQTKQSPPRSAAAPVLHAYPSVDSGYPAVTSLLVLNELQERLQQIRVTVTPERYRLHYQPTIEALAAWVLSLPLTESAAFMTPGGLLRCSLETAFHCQRMAEQSLFAASEQVEKRQDIEQRWCLAAFMAGLFAEVASLTTMTVVSPTGETWPCFTQPLSEFLAQQQSDRFYLSFRPVSAQHSLSSTLAQRILPPEVVQFMHDGHPTIVPTLLAAIDGKSNPSAPRLYEILTKARAGVLHQETLRQPQQYGRVRQGTHLEPYLIDALRSLAPGWRINTPTGLAWHTADGTFLDASVLREVAGFLRAKGIPGSPSSVETLAELLHAASVILATQEGRLFWSIYPTGTEVCNAIRLKQAEMIYGWETPPAMAEGILKAPKQPKIKSAPAGEPDLFKDTPLEAIAVAPASTLPVPTDEVEEGGASEATTEDTNAVEDSKSEPIEQAIEITQSPALQVVVDAPPAASHGGKSKKSPRPTVPTETKGQSEPERVTMPAPDVDLNNAADAVPVELRLGEHAETLLKQTHDPAISEFLRAVITDYNSGQKTGMQWCTNGFAIHREMLPRYGMDEMVLFTKLHGCGWLSKNPQKPNQKFLEVDFPDGKGRALVLKTIIAQDLGLARDA